MTSRAAWVAVFVAALAIGGRAQQNAALANLKTTAESSDYKSTSTHADVVKFMQAVDAASPIVFYTTYGKTAQGRDMPLAIVGTGLKDGSPASVLASGKLRVHIQGNIHAGEVEGKEAAQVLLRELAMGQHADLLESMVLLITPIYNADGNEAFDLNNRQRQNGPINGMGTRQQSQNINLNRDYTKLEAPESRAFVKMWNEYDPHVGFDLHTSDGSAHGYYLTYSPPLHPDTNDGIMNIMKGEWFPFITRQVKAKHNWDTFYYGNAGNVGGRGGAGRGRGAGAPGAGRGGDAAAGAAGAGRAGDPAAAGAARGQGAAGGGQAAGRGGNFQPDTVGAAPAGSMPRAWSTFEHVPRFHNNYVGMRNRFALLSEAYAYATFKDRILATNYFMEEALAFAKQNADRLKQAAEAADAETLVGRSLATRAAQATSGMVDILMGEVEDEKNPVNGAIMNRRKDVTRVEPMLDRMWFAPTAFETVPAEYYVPAAAAKSLDVLRAHGMQVRQLTAPVDGVEEFVITSNTARPANPRSIDTQNHELRSLEGYWRPATAPVPAGAFAIALNQKLGRLAFIMLAPTSDDGLVNWNFLDDMLQDGKPYPILRKR